MRKIKFLSQILVFALMLIAAAVAGTLAAHGNAWILIVTYWITLTLKNAVDWTGTMIKKGEDHDGNQDKENQ